MQKWPSEPVGDLGGAVRLVRQEEGEHAVVILLGPVVVAWRPVVELANEGQCLHRSSSDGPRSRCETASAAAAAGLKTDVCKPGISAMHACQASLWHSVCDQQTANCSTSKWTVQLGGSTHQAPSYKHGAQGTWAVS